MTNKYHALLDTLVKVSESEVPLREMQVLLSIKIGIDWGTGIEKKINASNGVGKTQCKRLAEKGFIIQKEKDIDSSKKRYDLTEEGSKIINKLFTSNSNYS